MNDSTFLNEFNISNHIHLIRGYRVMLDRDLALLYGVTTGNLNKAVRRNFQRFPSDFMFQLNEEENKNLKIHFGISSWGGTRQCPYAFTEHGIAMLSGILKSERAIQTNIAIIRIFIKMREALLQHKKILEKLEKIESSILVHDNEIARIFETLKLILNPSCLRRKRSVFGLEKKTIKAFRN
jgi:hypothetical protein